MRSINQFGTADRKDAVKLSFQPPEEDDPRDDDQRMRGYMGSTPDGGFDDHDESELPESLFDEVDAWFAQNTGLGGCSDKDVSELAGIFFSVTHGGGRESVDDALAVVDSFGPGVDGLNDTYARQVLIAQEVRRLRNALRTACDHIEMDALRISHCKDAAAIDSALMLPNR